MTVMTDPPPERSTCAALSLAMFALTVFLFACAWVGPRQYGSAPQPRDHDDARMAIACSTLATSVVGLVLGIFSRMRKEPRRDLAIGGIVLNGLWLSCSLVFLVVAYGAIGKMRGSDFH